MPKIDTTVGNLVDMIKNGELQLPELQRRFVWTATRVRDLLDSLYRGYPSGTILVWETEREMPTQDLAIASADSPFRGHKMLLDGQQRLTSLSAVLRGESVFVSGKEKRLEILFNLEHPDGPPIEVIEVEEDEVDDERNSDSAADEDNLPNLVERMKMRTFVVASPALLNDHHWVKVSDVFKGEKTDAQLLAPLISSFGEPSHRPVYLDASPQPHFYLRVGNTTQELVGNDVQDYCKNRFP